MRECYFIHFPKHLYGKTTRVILIIFSMVLFLILLYSEAAAEPAKSTFYISLGGSNSNPGTVDKPWKTFHFAIPKLRPGDTLILKNGIYTKLTTGLPTINCLGRAKNGTSTQRITIKAENERQAILSSDGSVSAFEMNHCSYWNIEGLRGQSNDLKRVMGGRQRSIFDFDKVKNVIIKRILATNTNRYFNTQAAAVRNSSNVLVEESEVYYFHRWGMSAFRSEFVNFRRNYVNSRDYADIPHGRKSLRKTTGDFGIGGYPTDGTNHLIIENCISENSGGGFQAGKNTGEGVFTKILGSIAIGGKGAGIQAATQTSAGAYNVLVENFVSIGNNNSVQNRAVDDMKVINATFYNNKESGVKADKHITAGHVRTYLTNVLSFNNSKSIIMDEQDDWSIENSNSHGNREDYPSVSSLSNTSGKIKNSISVQPTGMGLGQGQCIVYVPSTSNMKGAGKDGKDIGANIIYRYENGVLTGKKLWDQTTGQFPCGAAIKGINDDATFPTSSCINVHKRLNVGTNGCPIP